MEPKRTKPTPRTGESKPANINLLREMVKISRNSLLTQSTAKLITNKLSKTELNSLMEWFYLANRQQNNKNKGFVNTNFNHY